MADMNTLVSPDEYRAKLLPGEPDALRYDGSGDDPHEVAGMLLLQIPQRARVLDVGCGTGSVALVANRGKDNDVWGIEPDPERAALARARGLNIHCGFLDRPFIARHGPFDVVVLADVVEHVASPGELLSLAASALSPGGTMFISVPNVAHWSVRLSLLRGRFDYTETGLLDATHLRWFTEKTIRSLCRNCGLEILSIQHTAGMGLQEYDAFPWKLLPRRPKRLLVRILVRCLPHLFACQYLLRVRRSAA
jgi:methionine biosynthesis protein MetW